MEECKALSQWWQFDCFYEGDKDDFILNASASLHEKLEANTCPQRLKRPLRNSEMRPSARNRGRLIRATYGIADDALKWIVILSSACKTGDFLRS